MFAKIERNKRATLTILLVIVLGGSFWSGSRYPTLNEKAMMGGDAKTEDPLTFEAVWQSQPGDPLYRQVALSSLNWAAENRKGMTFGFLLGGAFLTLFGLFERRGTSNRFLNSLIGVGAGAPLGVCVNCAAPIARGLHSSGARIETTLSAMFSSPTLNIIVVTMMFSIFPIYLTAIKLGTTLFFLLIVIPLLSRTVFKNESADTYDDTSCPVPPPPIPTDESWLEAARGTAQQYAKNLWYIIKTTLPLMVLAGVLAALVVRIVPLEQVAQMEVSFLSILAVTLFGIFLPLPIALDLVMAAALLAAGTPIIYIGILLFTLGIYSVYSFSIVWTSISGRVAVTLAVVLMALGVGAGYAAESYHQWDMNRMLEALDEFS